MTGVINFYINNTRFVPDKNNGTWNPDQEHWLNVVNFLNTLGFISTEYGATHTRFQYGSEPLQKEKNDMIYVKWIVELCATGQNGDQSEIEGWQTVFRISENNYWDLHVPPEIDNASKTIEEPSIQELRYWYEWKDSTHDHYYGEGYYWVPSWSWGGIPISGTQDVLCDDQTGVNMYPRSEWQKLLNQGLLVPVTQDMQPTSKDK